MPALTAAASIRLINVKCPACAKGVITKVPLGTDMRKLIFYTETEKIASAKQTQVHKCPKCGCTVGLRIAT
ncbi:MAG: hypothetical protein LBJ12_05880 [Oscillospiraceae bacterium]|nr:hypothetical protein [Oscillospiraceae bacterium]